MNVLWGLIFQSSLDNSAVFNKEGTFGSDFGWLQTVRVFTARNAKRPALRPMAERWFEVPVTARWAPDLEIFGISSRSMRWHNSNGDKTAG